MMFVKSLTLCALVACAYGHGLITAVTGANGVTGVGFGVDASTPRNGGLPVPFEVRCYQNLSFSATDHRHGTARHQRHQG
jgi:hypothetical protein